MRVVTRRVVLSLVAAFALGTTAFGHMAFQRAAPAADSTITAPPTTIQVWFTQAPDAKVSKLEMAGPGAAVPLTGVHVMDGTSLMATVGGQMADGVYTVSWQSAGDDGHVQKGQYRFTLRRAAQ